ncbi:MAG TPA: 4a-hydroxytetrahydrobiopterin dehydratase [Bacteroidota bacterium]|nr:4a-hydroxytetrahydrobiopterin dehydratase [Bacteroidota bacterium]
MKLLTTEEIARAMGKLPGWTLDGKEIRTTFEFRDFTEAMGFVVSVALLAERANHHPDIDIRWNTVALALSTHSAGGLTEKDFALASRIAALR